MRIGPVKDGYRSQILWFWIYNPRVQTPDGTGVVKLIIWVKMGLSCQGVVEDRHDPLYLGRCRVRIFDGIQMTKKILLPNLFLETYPIQPITSPVTGVGLSPTGPVEGTFVVGFYRDGEDHKNQFSLEHWGGIPDPPPLPNKGFSDPRVRNISTRSSIY